MNWNDMKTAVEEAQRTMSAVDSQVNFMARLLEGRLHSVNSSTLGRLKRELRDYNIHTGRWSKE
jgi:hypothetical protein